MSHPSRIWVGVAGVIALAVLACAIGLFTTGLRLAVAGLTPGHGLFVVPVWHSILTGLIVIGIGCATLVVSCAAAYLAAWRRWDAHGHDWQDIVEKGGVRKAWDSLHEGTDEGEHRRAARDAQFRDASTARKARRERRLAKLSRTARLTALADSRERVAEEFHGAAEVHGKAAAKHMQAAGEAPGQGHLTDTTAGGRLLQILAGFNLLVLAGVIALGVGQIVADYQSAWWAVVPAGVIAFLIVLGILTTLRALDAHPHVHTAGWVLVGALAVLSSPPVGLLVITGVVISTWGRIFVRNNASRPLTLRLRSPLPWVIAAMYTAVAIGYLAMPPVSFSGVAVQTASAQFIGGSLAQSSDTVHLIVCTPLADATSTDARLATVPVTRTVKISANGTAVLDSGDRPTLPALVLNLFGIDWPHAIIAPNLHVRQATCAGAPPPRLLAGAEDPTLGAGAIAGPAPPGGRALDGEKPIEQTTDSRIAALARRYQPTLEVSVADRFWPVSVGAVLADIGPGGTHACLVTPAVSPTCNPVTSVPTAGRPADYLRFPTTANVDASALTSAPRRSSARSRPGSTRSRGRCISGSPTRASSTPGARLSCTSTTPVRCTSPASADSCRRGRRSRP